MGKENKKLRLVVGDGVPDDGQSQSGNGSSRSCMQSPEILGLVVLD